MKEIGDGFSSVCQPVHYYIVNNIRHIQFKSAPKFPKTIDFELKERNSNYKQTISTE